ncbi:hypothetical protein H2198_003260, partial [Neophaeococcomyces mojaviensis]
MSSYGAIKLDTEQNYNEQRDSDSRVSIEQGQRWLIEALGNRIGNLPHLGSTLREILQAYDWNLDEAEAAFYQSRARALNRRRHSQEEDDTDANTDHNEPQSPKSPDYQPGNTATGGPRFLGGKTIAEHLEGNTDEDDAQESEYLHSLPVEFRGW